MMNYVIGLVVIKGKYDSVVGYIVYENVKGRFVYDGCKLVKI